MSRRFAPVLCALIALLAVARPAYPADAMTTEQERSWGRRVAQSIVAEQGTLDDPLLTSWVKRIGASLVLHTVRNGLPYTFIVIDSEEVNAFSVPGGYIFVDAGLLNFVHSDDELAAVLGHEIGHVERRHVVTLTQKAKALEILLDVAGIFAPGVSRFGNLAGNLALYKLERVDELQADQYGLMLISQAGYDPEAMVSFLTRLSEDAPRANRPLQRYFETHPALPDRVAHVKGYPQLDRPPAEALLAQAIHDERTGEYFAARQKLQRISPAGSALARAHLQKLDRIFASADPGVQPTPQSEKTFSPQSEQPLSSQMKALLTLARRDRDNYERLLDSLDYSVDAQSLQSIGENTRLWRILGGQMRAGRYFDHSFDQSAQTIAEAADASSAAQRLLARSDQSPKIRSLAVTANVATVQSLQAARGAIATGWKSAATMRAFLDDFDAVSNYKGGDMQAEDYGRLHNPLRAALGAGRNAAQAADAAAALLNDAKVDLILAHLDGLDPLRTPEQRSSYASLLQHRFGVSPDEVEKCASLGLDAGAIAAAAIVAAQTGHSLLTTALRMRAIHASPGDFSAAAGVRAETLQLELGLVWTGYSDGGL